MKKGALYLCLLAGIVFLPIILHAEGEPAKWLNPASYLFHFIYEDNLLVQDLKAPLAYEVIVARYYPETPKARSYKGEVVNFNDQVSASFAFDPEELRQQSGTSAIAVKGPYFSDAEKVNFYNSLNEFLFSVPVGITSYCNDDGACDVNAGELADNCPNDCGISEVTPSESGTPGSTAEVRPFWNIGSILAAIGIIVCLLVFLVVRKK